MATGRPDPVEVWAPLFLTYAGSGAPKFTKEQVLADGFAILGDHCKLCDDKVTGTAKDHMRTHRKDLTMWLAKRRSEAAKKSLAGLAAARKEKKLQDETINEPKEDDDE
jgi:hypothetical protein